MRGSAPSLRIKEGCKCRLEWGEEQVVPLWAEKGQGSGGQVAHCSIPSNSYRVNQLEITFSCK